MLSQSGFTIGNTYPILSLSGSSADGGVFVVRDDSGALVGISAADGAFTLTALYATVKVV
ncbi:MAG TPA: hypothetical protein VFU74_21945 [Actinocrinis sp.]|nr:hypothetical protein [Actinocrinis sp.]